MPTSRRRCSWCPAALPLGSRPDARFCSGRCRVASHRAGRAAVPAELRARDRWVRCSARKVPLTTSALAASSTDPTTWTSYRDAAASAVGTGLGFVLNGDGLVCIDLDHALVEGVPTAAARVVLDQLPVGAFIEVSRSGEGLHVFGWSSFRGGRRFTVGAQSVEVYATGRFIAVTGNVFARGRLLDLDSTIADLLPGVRT